MKVISLKAKVIKDTRGDKTIEVTLKTSKGTFIASAPNGKSTGINEVPMWKKSLNGDIKTINDYFIEEINFNKFDDLKIIEDIFSSIIGGNSLIAIEFVFLKALAKQEEKEVWELINSHREKLNKFPMPVGNIMEGGLHSSSKIKPNFQEFHIIPIIASFEQAVKINKRAWENCREILKNIDKTFKGKTSDENAWITSLSDEQTIEVLKEVKDNMQDEFNRTIHIGMDIAASSFFKINKYIYKNPKSIKSKDEQIKYMQMLSKDFFYIEDPLEENDFEGFSKIKEKSANGTLIVGDDLTTTSVERIIAAKKRNSINGVIIKPNQIGSLLKVKEAVDYCKKNNIKTIFSHRSGETSENILADLAFGFGADFIKTGTCGKDRDEKLNRMIEIERSL